MKITYKSDDARREFDPKFSGKWEYPPQVKKKLLAMESFLRQSLSLQDVVLFTPYRFHLLKADLKGVWSLRVGNTGYRVLVIPCKDDGSEMIGGDIIAQCKQIRVIEVTGVTNHYE